MSATASAAPKVHLVGDTSTLWEGFALEFVEHLRIGNLCHTPVGLPADLMPSDVLLVLDGQDWSVPESAAQSWVQAGGTLILFGGAGTLEPLAGVTARPGAHEGHVRVVAGDAWARRFDVPLHAFGGSHLTTQARDVEIVASWLDDDPAIVRRKVGSGQCVVVGPDVWQSVGRIQQGWPVDGPGSPAPDGSAPVGADSRLRCDDGLALSFSADRALPDSTQPAGAYPMTLPASTPGPIFHRPHADLWRELVLQLVMDAAESNGTPIAWLHYWPAGTPAVGHISHDSDLNDDDHARNGVQAFAAADVRVTWCHCWPGGYSSETIELIGRSGHEHALHFNALHGEDDDDGMPWGPSSLQAQFEWASQLTGTKIVSNKNHYTRWEGWVEFFQWCEDAGIQIDQTRGPSKPGSVGFPYGTSHVYFPIDEGGRRPNVLSMPLHSQDVGWTSHEAVVELILDEAHRHHGVAHFLFHSGKFGDSARVAPAIQTVADGGRDRNMVWWTAAEVNSFERARRQVSLRLTADAGLIEVELDSAVSLQQAGVVVCVPPNSRWRAENTDGEVLPTEAVERHGRSVVEVSLDLEPGRSRFVLLADG